jgi:hypothetical protein
VISQVIVVGDEGRDLGFEIARQVIVLEQDAVLERLMPALDISLGHRMITRTTDVLDVLAVERRGQDVSEEHISKEGRARRDHGVSAQRKRPMTPKARRRNYLPMPLFHVTPTLGR